MKPLPAHPKILIIRMSSIGDIILTTPVVRQLREKYPNAQIDFVVLKSFAPVMAYSPHISTLFVVDTKKKVENETFLPVSSKTIPITLKNLKDHIRRSSYDVILDLHRNFRSVYLYYFWRRPPVLKIRKHKIIRFFLVHFKINLYPKGNPKPLSVAEKYLRAASSFGIDVSDQRLSLHLSPEVEEYGRQEWEKLTKDGFRIVMAPGARHFTKRWPPANYAKLIRQLYKEKGWRTVLAGGPDEIDIIQNIRRMAGEEITYSAAGKLSLSETFALIKHADFFISNDSGLMHAAAAFQRPQIAIFGSTVRELGFFPLNPQANVVENKSLTCRPCSHIGRSNCPKEHFKCMKDISVASLFDICRKLMKE